MDKTIKQEEIEMTETPDQPAKSKVVRMPTKTTKGSTIKNIKTSEIPEAELKRNAKEAVAKQIRFHRGYKVSRIPRRIN